MSNPSPTKRVDAFNGKHAIGTPVEYRRYPTAEPVVTVTRSEAWVMGGHTPVVLVDGVSGSVALFAIKVRR
jgi:hypothetical protein